MTTETLIVLFIAAAWQESYFNPKAYNYKEDAAGIVQIRLCVLEDLKQFKGKNYSKQDRFDVNKSFEIFCSYTKLWIDRRHLNDTAYNRARIWNGGACAYKSKAAKLYAERLVVKYSIIAKAISLYEVLKNKTKTTN